MQMLPGQIQVIRSQFQMALPACPGVQTQALIKAHSAHESFTCCVEYREMEHCIGLTSVSEGGASNLAAAVGLARASSTPVFCSASTLNSPFGSALVSVSLSVLLSDSPSCK